jgi:predicted nucleic acid-binding protein
MKEIPLIVHPDEAQIQPDASRLYFFDANIWLQLLQRQNTNKELQPYVRLWDRLSNEGLPFVVVNPVLVSEVFNTFLRIRFNRWRRLPATAEQLLTSGARQHGDEIDYKRHYRPTEEYRSWLRIMLDEFSSYGYLRAEPAEPRDVDQPILTQLLDGFGSDADFNDQYYVEYCRQCGLVLVTQDGDFYPRGLEVITANQKTLDTYADMQRRKGGRTK